MPNVRLRQQDLGLSPYRVVLRPLLAFGAIVRDAAGATPLFQAEVFAYNSGTGVLSSREVTFPNGMYTVSTPDANAYFAVAIQDGTFDSTTLTWDNTTVTFDRTQSVGGVTVNSMVGIS